MSSGTTPFERPECQLAEQAQSEQLKASADAAAAIARQANQRGDNYVMMTIASALAIILVGIASKMRTFQVHVALTGLAAFAVLATIVTLMTFPVTV